MKKSNTPNPAVVASDEKVIAPIMQVPGFHLNISGAGIEKIINQHSGAQVLLNKRLKLLGRSV